MICLAVNAATSVLSVALVRDEEVLHLYESHETRDQGNLLIRHAQDALDKSGLEYQDLDLLAAVTGPGSFTGIRLGIAAVRGLGMAANVPVTGVNSFDLYAARKEGALNLVAIESWREELYFRLIDDKGQDVIAPVNITPEEMAEKVKGEEELVVVSGDAAEKILPLLPNAHIATQDIPNAGTAARLAIAQAEHMRPVPFYLRGADISKPKS